MFDLPPLVATDNDLEALALAMRDVNPEQPRAGQHRRSPPGFTYLGQFIDHDISLDLSPLSAKQEDPTMIQNFRTPGLDLDCLYGAGPGPHRFLFRQDAPKFLIGTARPSPGRAGQHTSPICRTISNAPATASRSSAITATTRTSSSRRLTLHS